jgi:hypothetical protein
MSEASFMEDVEMAQDEVELQPMPHRVAGKVGHRGNNYELPKRGFQRNLPPKVSTLSYPAFPAT